MNTPERRPSVFIGSSSEGLSVAEAIQLNLDHACDATIWSQGVFGLSLGSLESLVEELDAFDFAILVLTPDDMVESRGESQPSPRDNVLLELGLCIGALGRERTFMVYDRSTAIKLPSDLAGVTPADYQPHSSGNLQSAVGAGCTRIKNAISGLGIRQEERSAVINQSVQFQIIHDLLNDSCEQFIILMHEKDMALVRESNVLSPGVVHTYEKHDRSAGHGEFSVDKLCRQLADAELLQPDLRNNIKLTQRGKDFAVWLIDHGHKARGFDSPLGSWGEFSADMQAFFKRGQK